MLSRARSSGLRRGLGSVRRVIRYAFHDWSQEMTPQRRLITMTGIVLQGWAFWALLSRSLIWPVIWPRGPALYASAWVLYILGYFITNVMLTSEFVRKTQLESDLIAAQQIQRTLQPERIEEPVGYELETYYKPFRGVGGDYFDVIGMQGDRVLFALADVSGKGMPAALLASNIQALVRSIAGTEPDLAALAKHINRHLVRYTPRDRFATAVFILLTPESGQVAYVNAGHNAPMISGSGSTRILEATGLPLGLFASTEYEVRAATMQPGDLLLIFTDGLPDSISGEDPGRRLRDALTSEPGGSLANLKRLVDPVLSEDDITILLVKRAAADARLAVSTA